MLGGATLEYPEGYDFSWINLSEVFRLGNVYKLSDDNKPEEKTLVLSHNYLIVGLYHFTKYIVSFALKIKHVAIKEIYEEQGENTVIQIINTAPESSPSKEITLSFTSESEKKNWILDILSTKKIKNEGKHKNYKKNKPKKKN